MTVNSMSAFFMPPKDLQLDELTNATLMKLEQFRDKTSTGVCRFTRHTFVCYMLSFPELVVQCGSDKKSLITPDFHVPFIICGYKIVACTKTVMFIVHRTHVHHWDSEGSGSEDKPHGFICHCTRKRLLWPQTQPCHSGFGSFPGKIISLSVHMVLYHFSLDHNHTRHGSFNKVGFSEVLHIINIK